MANDKKKKIVPPSDHKYLQDEVAKLQQQQAEWKKSHSNDLAGQSPPQNPLQKRRQERIAKRHARQQKAITDVNEFFDHQQKMLADKWQELELTLGERQKLTQMKREKRIAARKARQNARKEASVEWRALRKQNRDDRAESLQTSQQESKDHTVDRLRGAKDNRIEKKDQTKQFRDESKQLRKRNWQQYVRRSRRRRKRFIHFQNRLWWKGYVTFLAWIVSIFLVLIGIFYLFQLFDINLIEVAQNLYQQDPPAVESRW